MAKSANIIIFLVATVITVVAVDVLVFRHYFWQRLMSNIGIVLIYIALYMRFLKH